MECDFCNKVLTTKGNLNYHKKNNKECLILQLKLKANIESALVQCTFCNKNFSESNINNHIKNCKKKWGWDYINF